MSLERNNGFSEYVKNLPTPIFFFSIELNCPFQYTYIKYKIFIQQSIWQTLFPQLHQFHLYKMIHTSLLIMYYLSFLIHSKIEQSLRYCTVGL